jgi:hypothetical protein
VNSQDFPDHDGNLLTSPSSIQAFRHLGTSLTLSQLCQQRRSLLINASAAEVHFEPVDYFAWAAKTVSINIGYRYAETFLDCHHYLSEIETAHFLVNHRYIPL